MTVKLSLGALQELGRVAALAEAYAHIPQLTRHLEQLQ